MKKTIFFILVFFLLLNKINASEKTLKREYLEGIYFVQHSNTDIHDYFSSQHSIFYIDNKLVYCIEPNKAINNYQYQETSSSDFNLSEEQINYIEMIGKYGYDYKNHQTINYYLAAQELIWESLKDIKVYWTTEQYGYGNEINVEYEKNEILNLITKHEKKPSFGYYQLNPNVGSTFNILDENNALNDYLIPNSVHNVSINGDKINFQFHDTFIGTENLIFKKNITGEKSRYYKAHNSQAFAYLNYQNQYEFRVEINSIGEEIKIYQQHDSNYDKNDNLKMENAIYEVFDESNNLITTIKTDENGLANTENILPLGEYCVKLKQSSIGYVNDNQKNCFKVETGSGRIHRKFYLKPINNDVNIFVGYKNDIDEFINPINDIKFDVLDEFDNIVNSLNTNNGYINTNLIYGNYKIIQKNSIFDFPLNENINISVVDENKVNDFELIEEIILPKIKINIKDEFGNLIDQFITVIVKNDHSQHELSIQKNILLTGLYEGIYSFELKDELINNYVYNKEVITVDTSNKFVLQGENIIEIDIWLKEVKAVLNINSLINNTELLPNPEPIQIYQENELINTLIPDDNGNISILLPLGNYCLKNNDIFDCFTIEYIDQYTEYIVVNKEYIKKIELETKKNNEPVIKSNNDQNQSLEKNIEGTSTKKTNELILKDENKLVFLVPDTYKDKINNKKIILFLFIFVGYFKNVKKV